MTKKTISSKILVSSNQYVCLCVCVATKSEGSIAFLRTFDCVFIFIVS